MKKKWLIAVWIVGLAAAFFAGSWWSSRGATGTGSGGSITRTPEPDDVIDQELMLALGQAKNFHHKAKVYMSDGKVPEAIAAVRSILSLKFPAGAPEADDVRNDARALLGRLLSSQNQLDEAMRVVEEGLASSTRESFFVANLHTVKGEIHYARATAMDANDPKAVIERRSAIDELDKSIKINEMLMKQPPPPAPGTK